MLELGCFTILRRSCDDQPNIWTDTLDFLTAEAHTRDMTRKDFTLIAQALRNSKCEFVTAPSAQAGADQYLMTVAYVAQELATTNPNFDRQKFAAACEVVL